MCLGVKDTHYVFNAPFLEYSDKMEQLSDAGHMEVIDYALAHNIIFAGLEFSSDYRFKPHKDFTSVTVFMLEEDTDDVELIEIECGLNGIPAYMRGPYDNKVKVNYVINQLEKTAGPGNYILLDKDDDMMT
jgi:hypothetical protein